MTRSDRWKSAVIVRYVHMHKRFPPPFVKPRDRGLHRSMAIERWKHRLRGAEGTLTLSQWYQLLDKYDRRCAWCKGKARGGLTMDHVTPKAFGGGFSKDNIVPACGFCNRLRGTATDAIIKALGLQDKDKRRELLDEGGST